MKDEELVEYFRKGLIPGPSETEEVFLERVKDCLALSHSEWSEAAEKTLPKFGFAIDWVPIEYSNRKLAWWEGAATWIGKKPLIQLRTRFQKGTFLGYSRTDILAHEAIHAARLRFEEPLFEEILAYAIAPRRWKQFLGPVFTHSWELLIFLAAFVAGGVWLFVPLLVFIGWLGWLSWRQLAFKRCLRKWPLSVVLCLTDSEIRHCRLPTGRLPRERLIHLLQSQSSVR